LFGEMRKLAHEAGDRTAEGFALTRLAGLAPEVADAKRLYVEALSITEDDANDARARAYLGLVRCDLRLGSPKEAERILSQIPTGDLEPKTRLRVLLVRGDVAMRQSHYEAALEAYRSAWDEPERAQLPPQAQARIGASLGEAALHASNTEIARG